MLLRVALIGTLLLGLLGLGGVAFLALRGPAATPVATPVVAPPARVAVLGAARQLRAGALLKPDDIALIEMPATLRPEGASGDGRAERAALVGAMIRRPMGVGEVLLPADLLRPGERGFLAAVLAPGARAITVGVDAVSGTGGLIWPGDRVDVLLTQSLEAPDLPAARRFAGETVLGDVRVIAIDRQLVQGAVGDAPDANRGMRTVTLETTGREAERLAVAVRLGRLSMVVRSALEGAPGADAEGAGVVTWAGDVSPALRVNGPAAANPSTIRVYQGAAKSEEYRF